MDLADEFVLFTDTDLFTSALDDVNCGDIFEPVDAPITRPVTGMRAGKISSSVHANKLRRAKYNSKIIAQRTAKAPNMSRRISSTPMYAFPSFDKCDSLVFLPISMIRFISSDDFPKLRKLMKPHTAKDCTVELNGAHLSMSGFLDTLELLMQAYPDSLMCVRDTSVQGNVIRAVICTKITDNNVVYTSVAQANHTKHPVVFADQPRAERLNEKMAQFPSRFPENERNQLTQLAARGVDLEAFLRLEWEFHLDNVSRKITRFVYKWELADLKGTSDALVDHVPF